MIRAIRTRLADLLRALSASVRPPPEAPPVRCTGVSASWCPIHGNCICTPSCPECGRSGRRWIREERGGAFYLFQCLEEDCGLLFEDDGDFDRNDPDCPLHGTESDHADLAEDAL